MSGRWQAPANFRRYGEVLVRVAPEFTTFGASVQFRCPFPERHKRQDRSPSAWAKIGSKGELVCRCSSCGAGWKEFVEYAGLPAPAWFPPDPNYPGRAATPRRRPPVNSKIVAEYPYTDWRTGELLAVKLRWEPGFQGGRKKDFTWRRPLPDQFRRAADIPAGAAAWCGGPGVLAGGEFSPSGVRDGVHYFRPTDEAKDRQAYRLAPLEVGPYREFDARRPENEGRALFVCEGEGKADALWSLGFVAVSSPHGKGSWLRDWGATFSGRPVVVVPDRDPPDDAGIDWGTRVVASAIGYGAAAVCLPLVPRDGFPADASVDVKDWLLSLAPDTRASALKSLVSKHKMYKRGA